MAKSTKNASAQKSNAKAGKSAQQATTGAKVGKVAGKRTTASAQQKPAAKAPAKATKSGQQSAPRRSQFAGMSIKNLVPKGETPCRGGALVRYEAIVSHKRVDDAIGSTYRIDGESEDRTINAADIAYLVKRELISVA